MARAYATFANAGQAVTPLAIQYVMDRNGRMVLEVEKELRAGQQARQKARQIMTPQTAYIMTHLLRSTVQWGTLRWASGLVGGFATENRGQDRYHTELVGRLDGRIYTAAGDRAMDGFR